MLTRDATPDVLRDNVVIIVGGGPVGLILSQTLSVNNVQSILFERNSTTTSWPKMDLTNARSMELFRRLGLADELRTHGDDGVPSDINQDVFVSTGMSHEPLSKWELPSVEKYRARIREQNDGTQPQEPWQRISQEIFERWLKGVCDADPLVDGSPVRALLVHFRSRDLGRLHKHGRFWHIFLADESGGLSGATIAQDEIDTWTTHWFLPDGFEADPISSEDVVARVLGGMYEPYPVKVDKILVRSVWQPVIAVTKQWSGPNRRIFLAGDAAHQNIPTGGYDMNMGIADAFDIGWKLASVVNGNGGSGLLASYEAERKPVAERSVAHSGLHFQTHASIRELLTRDGLSARHVDEDTEQAIETRRAIQDHYRKHDGENKDLGIEMGYRYNSPVIVKDADDAYAAEPPWTPASYTPTTWPGSRAPHIFLSNGLAIFDQFGRDLTLLTFDCRSHGQEYMIAAAQKLSVSLEVANLSGEDLAKRLYERNLVLIRPDQHVAWRSNALRSSSEAETILQIVTGR